MELALITIREMWGLESRSRTSRSRPRLLWKSLGLEVWDRSRSRLGSYGLDYITDKKFVEFELDPDWKSLQNFGSRPDLDWVNGKEMQQRLWKRWHFSNFLDLDFAFEINFGLCQDLDSRGERILIFQLLIHIRKLLAYSYPILIRKFLKFSIRYPSVSECDTG